MTTRKAAKTEYRPAAPARRQTAALTEERTATNGCKYATERENEKK